MTNNLLKTVQQTNLSVMSGQQLVSLTVETLEKKRSDRDFDLSYELISKKASAISSISKPELPRKRSKPKYSLLQYFGVRREASNCADAYHSTHQHLKLIYFEATGSIVSAIKGRFKKPNFSLFSDVDQYLGCYYNRSMEKTTDKNWITP